MKRMVFCFIPLLMVLMGCASKAVAVARDAPSAKTAVVETKVDSQSVETGAKDLDAAIREAAAQMGENLPGGTKVALVSVASSSAQLSEYIISRLEAALVSGKKLVVVDQRQKLSGQAAINKRGVGGCRGGRVLISRR